MAPKTTKMIGELQALNRWEEGLTSPYEHMWVLIGEYQGDLWHGRMYPMAAGSPALVSFNGQQVLEQEEKYGNVVGFLHTHPSFTSHYSSRDDRTMKAWVACFGKPLVCAIKGTDGLTAWWYANDEDAPEFYQVKRIGKILFGVTPELYELDIAGQDPAEGLEQEDDPAFKPVEDFMPDDERAEWQAYIKQLESEGNYGKQQVSPRRDLQGERPCEEAPGTPPDGVWGGGVGKQPD